MKKFFIAALFIIFSKSASSENASIADTVTIIGQYDVEIDYPFPEFLSRMVAMALGFIEPKQFFLKEIYFGNDTLTNYLITVKDNNGKTWLSITSDDSLNSNSFLEPPLSKKEYLAPSAIAFLKKLLIVLKQPAIVRVKEKVLFGEKQFTAIATRKQKNVCSIYIKDEQNQDFIAGEIKTASKDSYTIYPTAYFKFKIFNSDLTSIGVTVVLKSITITKKIKIAP